MEIKLVDRSTGEETPVDCVITGGRIDRDDGTKLKESASVTVKGTFSPGPSLVRVYAGGAPVGTFVPSVKSIGRTSAVTRTPVKLDGRLCELDSDMFDGPVTFAKGTSTVGAAAGIVKACGLDVVMEDESTHVLAADRTYGIADDDSTKLDAVNDLLGIAGFDSAMTDEYGRVAFRRSKDIGERPVSAVFGPGNACPDGDEECDSSNVANVVHVVYSDVESSVMGVAADEDPTSMWSVPSLGRRIVKKYQYDGVASQQQADAKAASLLAGQQSVVRKARVRAPLGPTIGDAVDVDLGDIRGRYAVRSLSCDLGSPSLMTDYTLRRFDRG